MKDNFEIWSNRAYWLLTIWSIPYKLTYKSRTEIHILGILISIPWFILTLPIQLILLVPAIFCILMSIRHL